MFKRIFTCFILVLSIVLLCLWLWSILNPPKPPPKPTPSFTPTRTEVVIPPTFTFTPEPTFTFTPTLKPTKTPTPTHRPTWTPVPPIPTVEGNKFWWSCTFQQWFDSLRGTWHPCVKEPREPRHNKTRDVR